MTRQEEIQRIKEEIRIEDLIKSLGIKWWRAGTDKIKIRSLINIDKEPSCFIYTSKNNFYDFSANIGGSVIDFYIYATQKSYIYAIKELRSMLNNNSKETKIKIRLNDYAECRKNFENLMSLIMAIKQKTIYLKKVKTNLRELHEQIAKEIFEVNENT